MTETDELRRLLDERGVEWEDMSIRPYACTSWRDPDGEPCTALEGADDIPDGKLSVQALLTPEQAIAATLGSCNCSNNCTNGERTSERIDLDAAMLGAYARPTQAESSGTLTAEKVRELMEENSRQYPSPTDPYVWLTEYDWQAIANELNATLGRRTCHVMTISEFNGEGTEYYDYCSNCGYEFFDDDPFNYCPSCGLRIEVDDG